MTSYSPYPPRTDLMRWDSEADEPYMSVPTLPDIRMTPWRESDAEQALYNEPSIGEWAFRRPYPYTPESLSFIRDTLGSACKDTINTILRPLLRAPASPTHPLAPLPASTPVPLFPFIIIRHHPSGRMIGDVQIFQPVHPDIPADEVKASFAGRRSQVVSPADQTWEVGYNLSPEWTGQGIAGKAVDCLIEGWMQWVGIGTLMVGDQVANTNSTGLIKSRGFVHTETFMEAWPKDKGGGEREMAHYELDLSRHKPRLPPL